MYLVLLLSFAVIRTQMEPVATLRLMFTWHFVTHFYFYVISVAQLQDNILNNFYLIKFMTFIYVGLHLR
jgi:hypothetical protein